MTSVKSLSDLLGALHSFEEASEIARTTAIFHSERTQSKSSDLHGRFASLMAKYASFADDFKQESAGLKNLLSNAMQLSKLKQLQQKNEEERLTILKQIEVISTHSAELVDNLSEPDADIDSTPACCTYNLPKATESNPVTPMRVASSMKTDAVLNDPESSSATDSENNDGYEAEAVHIPEPELLPASVPVLPLANKARKTPEHTPAPQPTYQPSPAPSQQPLSEQTLKAPVAPVARPAYTYVPQNVVWRFNGVQRSSTVLYVGNLPSAYSGVSMTKEKLGHFLRLRFCVTPAQIEEINLRRGRTPYALVRFSAAVPLGQLRRQLTKINKANQAAYEEMKESGKTQESLSWKRKVYVRFNEQFVLAGDDMWCDPSARHELFIRNFDIMDKKCHAALTHTLGELGELYQDVEIRIDGYGDPYCLAIFRYIDDAIVCRNSKVEFGGRMLEIRYSKF